MSSKYHQFDRNRLKVLPLSERKSLIDTGLIEAPKPCTEVHPSLKAVAEELAIARDKSSSRILMIGAHVIRSGMQRYIFDLMEKGMINCIAVNGACAIHDFEFALLGQTTECVATYISNGQFGLWNETGLLNDIISQGNAQGLGFGEAVGKYIYEKNLPHSEISLFAKAYELGIPVTVHAGIGYDIIHEHPNCDGAAIGEASYRDFLIFAAQLEQLEHGVIMNFGSAIMAPEIYLKALAMVRNAAASSNPTKTIRNFTTLVCDLHDLPDKVGTEAPKNDAQYYFRPWKTMLVRTVADGGKSYYVRGFHQQTIPQLWTAAEKL
ncbi:hypothetical protein [Desulfovibrio sp. JC022]|uniref:ornithine cyclodeaminase family domain n=1 Tax=Desulfovibrio sp. JC022 TaxID=2593642 RepID=UPI0013D6792E|nr:hypothetical protein [Desulfovibrio sp. JC022]NDV23223.1 hypothetical protein [Desulfovibrio sp. JC022]